MNCLAQHFKAQALKYVSLLPTMMLSQMKLLNTHTKSNGLPLTYKTCGMTQRNTIPLELESL